MKNLASFQKQSSKLNQQEMKSLKGGTGGPPIFVEAMIDICFQGANGNLHNIYCDRRRRRVGGSN